MIWCYIYFNHSCTINENLSKKKKKLLINENLVFSKYANINLKVQEI